MVRRRFVTLDVFTERRFAGNPLAVVLEPAGLDRETMQAIAREFNLSETVFVSPPRLPSHRAQLRIFTPAAEIAFAGHPTVGTAVLLGCLDQAAHGRELVLEEGIGDVRCVIGALSADGGRARFELPHLPIETGPAAPTSALAAALSLSTADIGFEAFVPACWSAGVPITFVPVCGLEPVRTARIDARHWDAIDPPAAVYVFCREPMDQRHHFHARMFAPRLGVPEDPATGSAVAALAGVLGKYAKLADSDHQLVVEQGYEMGRPSLIELWLTMKAGKLARAAVSGNAVLVSEGTIEA
jgi:trans-2,3-dihydro-3-hydroxyanthranilate isomerase